MTAPGSEGHKRSAAIAIFDSTGETTAFGRATWIALA